MDRSRLDAARAAIERGALDEAAALLAVLRQEAPGDVNVLNLSAVCALRRGALADADTLSAEALARAPGARPLVANRVLVLRRRAADRAAGGQVDAAAGLLHAALALDPEDQSARADLLRLAVDTSARIGAPAGMHLLPRPQHLPSLAFITCSIDPAKRARFEANVATHFAEWPHERLILGDARSLAEAYNRGMDQVSADWLVFCHDDIEFVQVDAAWRLHAALASFALVGVAGTTRLSGPTALWSGPAYGYCQVAHVDPQGQLLSGLYGLGPGHVAGAQALDGVFLACHRDLAQSVRFDAGTFDHFHLYDTDFSWRASRTGWPVGITQDLLLIHHSLGAFDATWEEEAARFLAKHPEVPAAPAHPSRVLMQPNTRDRLVATHAWLAHWQALGPAGATPLPAES